MSVVSRARCFCGNVAIELSGEPETVVYCHCGDCRRWSGAPVSVFVGYAQDKVEMTAGEPEAFGSSPGVLRSFCRNCGTSIFYQDERLPGEVYLSVGIMERPEDFEPEAHSWYSKKLGWLELHDGLPRHEESSRPR